MLIGIDASRAFLKNRTGIEEYSYQVIQQLTKNLQKEQVVLYVKKSQKQKVESQKWPENWKIKIIKWPRFWTQIGLSLEMILHTVDVLFVPAHTVPIIHPKKTVVTIHGLEYEFISDGYSRWEKFYMRWSIKKSCNWVNKIISVSQNTKSDLLRLYNIDEQKIKVIYEGYSACPSELILESRGRMIENLGEILKRAWDDKPFLLFVGRIEERKNIVKIIEAFEILKNEYQIPHSLMLAGKPGYGYESAKCKMQKSKWAENIIELGYVSEDEKWTLLKNADVFVFPTLYEGFGIPILEAQSMGCPVVAAQNSAIPEIVGDSALLVNPHSSRALANEIQKLLSDETLKNAIMQKGLENVKRFSWQQCAEEISELILNLEVLCLKVKNKKQ